jgi:hypothetical protein
MQATNEKRITRRKHSWPTAGRGTSGQFPVGVSGNPAGRPQGHPGRKEPLLDFTLEALEKFVKISHG